MSLLPSSIVEGGTLAITGNGGELSPNKHWPNCCNFRRMDHSLARRESGSPLRSPRRRQLRCFGAVSSESGLGFQEDCIDEILPRRAGRCIRSCKSLSSECGFHRGCCVRISLCVFAYFLFWCIFVWGMDTSLDSASLSSQREVAIVLVVRDCSQHIPSPGTADGCRQQLCMVVADA